MGDVLISVDIEASGPIPGEHGMLSIGAAVVGEIDKTFYAELKPIGEEFEPEALAIAGISLEKLKVSGADPGAAMDLFAEWVEKVADGRHPVFSSFGTFDWLFTKWYLVKYSHAELFGPNGIDMKSYYMGMMNSTWTDARKKNILPALISKKPHTHNARDDAIEQAELFQNFLRYNAGKLSRKSCL